MHLFLKPAFDIDFVQFAFVLDWFGISILEEQQDRQLTVSSLRTATITAPFAFTHEGGVY